MTCMTTIRPASVADLRDAVADAARDGTVIEARGGGTKRAIGHPDRKTAIVDLGALSGIVDYAPTELVITATPATPLAEVEALLAANGQMLAFEPWDHAAVFGDPDAKATIGGIVAAGVSGPRRLSAGAARDHLLGFEAVSGRAEVFRSGAKVVKNVTGFDIPKAMAGSWGQLGIMTELTLKVLPAPRASTTVAIEGLSPDSAIAAMADAMGSPCSVAAAAHMPAHGGSPAVTALRLEGFAESVVARAAALCDRIAHFGKVSELTPEAAGCLWQAVTIGSPVGGHETLWRVHVAPSRAAETADAVTRAGGAFLFDWAGAALWVGAPSGCDVRAIACARGGHAMLVRAAPEVRREIPARQAASPGVAVLSERLRRAFDPSGILDPRRFA